MFTVVEIIAGTKYDLGRHAWDIPLGDFEYLAEFTWLAEFSFLVFKPIIRTCHSVRWEADPRILISLLAAAPRYPYCSFTDGWWPEPTM